MLYAIKLNIKLLFAVLSFVEGAFVQWNRPTTIFITQNFSIHKNSKTNKIKKTTLHYTVELLSVNLIIGS